MWTLIQSSSSLYFTFVLLVTFLVNAVPTSAQTQCSQKLSSLPSAAELYGFRLGMTKEEVKALVPQTKFGKGDDYGVAKTTINPGFDPKFDKQKFSDVRTISLDFLDERLTSLWIGFEATYKAHTVDDFVQQITESLHLSGTWTSWRSRGQQLRCEDFQVIVTAVAGGPSVRILDVSAEETVAARRLAKEQEREAATESPADPGGPAGATAEPEEIIGDKNSKTYYPPGCKPARQIAEQSRFVFKSIEEAQKSGFKLAKTCH